MAKTSSGFAKFSIISADGAMIDLPVETISGPFTMEVEDPNIDPEWADVLRDFPQLDITIEFGTRPPWEAYQFQLDGWFMLRAYQYLHNLTIDRAYLPLGV